MVMLAQKRVNYTVKCIFLKLKYNMSLICNIHYLHPEAFHFFHMPTIACSKALTCDFFVCSSKELTSLTDFRSPAEVSSLPDLLALPFPEFSL